ncbi:hypothetical protein ACQCVP_14725 [Rossellomorea vietnamensis]
MITTKEEGRRSKPALHHLHSTQLDEQLLLNLIDDKSKQKVQIAAKFTKRAFFKRGGWIVSCFGATSENLFYSKKSRIPSFK